jgi:hypothetical protein
MKVRLSVVCYSVCIAAVLVCPVWLLLVYSPGWAFPYRTQCDRIMLRSDEPFNEAAARSVLAAASAKLRSSAFFRPDISYTVCVCNSSWRRKFFFLVQSRAGGLHYYFADTVFLSGAKIEENRLVSPSGRLILGDRTLDYFITHEVGHALAEKAVGVWQYHRLKDWIKEGYVDYVARGSALKSVKNRSDFLIESAEMNLPVEAPYLRFNLLVAYYLERSGWSPLRLHRENVSREDAEREVRIGLQTEEANKSLQPTPTAVMPPAAQEIMPAVGVAEH